MNMAGSSHPCNIEQSNSSASEMVDKDEQIIECFSSHCSHAATEIEQMKNNSQPTSETNYKSLHVN